MTEYLFIFSAFLIIYVYAGYPACLLLLSQVADRKSAARDHFMTASIVISAYNEAKEIAATLQNKLQLDYPHEYLEIIVVSDGSDDDTDRIVQLFEKNGIKFIRQTPRQGKTSAINKAVSEARGEIILFSDANSFWQVDAIKKLVRNFHDKSVGYVTGKMVYTNPDGSLIGDGCSAYMKYENIIRNLESRFSSVIGVDGGIDAVRKELYLPMRSDQLPDFVLPLMVMEQGYRVVFESEAILNEQVLSNQDTEYRMRIRVALRALWALYDMRHLLNLFQFPMTGWQIISHKLLRYLAWAPLMICLIVNPLLLGMNMIYPVIMVVQIIFYLMAYLGYQRRHLSQVSFIFYAPYYFILLNIAAAVAFLRFIRGEKQVLWKPRSG